jgi:molybdopterin/thiamine biosynthesis adenylyltransferase
MNFLLPAREDEIYRHELAIDSYWKVSYWKLMDCRVTVLGVGGFGTPVAFALTRMGVRRLHLVDRDVVEASNLPRHMLYLPRHVGRPKVDAAVETLRECALRTEVTGHHFDVLEERAETARLVKNSDFVFTMFDSRGATIFASWLCARAAKPMVSGGVDQTTGFSFMWRYQKPGGRPCEECFARSTAVAPEGWARHYLSMEPVPRPAEVTEFDRCSSCADDSPIVYTSAGIGAMEMVNVFLRHRMGKEQPSQVRVNAMDQQSLYTRGDASWASCPVCGTG